MSKTSHLLSKQNSQQPKQFRGGEKKVMKKSLSLLVAIAMVFSMFATLVSADGKSAGQKLQDLGVINGTSNGLDENEEWLRQDVTVLIARLFGAEEEAKATANTHGFEDLDSKFYNGFVSWAKEKGYFNGESATKFGVGNPITNQQFAAVLLRVLNVDVEYAEAFDKAVELGLVSKDLDKAANAIRGDIYESLVTALDFKIDGKKLGTILGLKGYENNFDVAKATATNSKTVVVEFSQEVGSVLASNFAVKEVGTESVEVISSVSASENKVTINLIDTLSNEKTYVVEASGIANKDASASLDGTATAQFTYNKSVATSVVLNKTAVAYGDEVTYTLKDANGNDVTADYDLSEVAVVQSSDQNVILIEDDYKLKAQSLNDDATGYSVVNVVVTIDENVFETGATAVQVKSSVAVVNGIGKVSFDSLDKDEKHSIFKSETATLDAEVLGADGKKVESATPNFKSLNPTVLVVDQTSGVATGIKSGTATVVVTSTFNGKTVSKSVVITVKDDAKLAGVDVEKSSVKVVKGSGIEATVKVTLKDQYGDVYKGSDQAFTVKASKAGIVDGFDSTDVQDLTADKGEYKLEIRENTSLTDDTGSAILTIQAGTFKKTISVSVVKGGGLVGYAVELGATKIDANQASQDDFKHALKEKTSSVTVYSKDSAGNYLSQVPAGDVTIQPVDANQKVLSIDNATNVISAGAETGSAKVNVLVNDVRIGTYEITVVDTTRALAKVVQAKNALTVDKNTSNIEDLIVGKTDFVNGEEKLVDGALVGYDQYGDKIQITNYLLVSSNSNVIEVSVDGENATSKDKADTVTVTVIFNINNNTVANTVAVKVR